MVVFFCLMLALLLRRKQLREGRRGPQLEGDHDP